MPRPNRIFFESGLYHVYNRLGRGEQFFELEEEAQAFVNLLREIVKRDELTVYAWCLMSNHYHLAVRCGAVSLDRPMKSLQQRTAHRINARNRVSGPLWQGRYRAKLVNDQNYLDQLLIYIHLNPIQAGVVSDLAQYPWSGHLELVEKTTDTIVDVDEVLRVFGNTRRSARAAYGRRLKAATEEDWIGEGPGHLPWWKLGRPSKSEEEDPETTIRCRLEKEKQGPEWRPVLTAEEFVDRASGALDTAVDVIRSRTRSPVVVRSRELLIILGVERYRLKVKDIAEVLQKSPTGVSQTLARATGRRQSDTQFAADFHRLDHHVSENSS